MSIGHGSGLDETDFSVSAFAIVDFVIQEKRLPITAAMENVADDYLVCLTK